MKQKISLTKKSKGYSLIELMIAAGIGTVVALGVSSVFVFALEQFTIMVEQNAAEESLLWTAYNLRSFFGQAIDIRGKTAPVDQLIGAGAAGQVLTTFNSDPASGTAENSMTLIGLFAREAQDNAASGGSRIFSTAVYFRAPPAAALGTGTLPFGGTLYFIYGQNGGGGGVMAPDTGQIWFDRISRFQISEIECVTNTGTGTGAACNGEPAKSITFILKVRYFKTAKRGLWIWQDPPPNNVGLFRDLEMTVKVGFKNNQLLNGTSNHASNTGGTTEEYLHGGVYFFKMPLPVIQ